MPRKKKGKFTTAIWVLGSLTVIAIIVGALSQSEESSSNEEIDLQQAANTQEQQDMNVELVKESIYDVPIKTQIDQRWYVTQVPESEDSLRTLINTLHERAQERREFKHHNPATNIYIYVYQDEDTAKTEQKGADWLGMSQKSYSDRTNKVTINANRLAKMNETPEIRSGLEAHVRKQIFEELVKSEERAREGADKKYPDPDDWSENAELNSELRQKYRDELLEKHNITDSQMTEIIVEGLSEGFH